MVERSTNIKVGKNQLEVISGSMYGGKTDELIRRLVRVDIAKLKAVAFKPSIDSRYSEFELATHSGAKYPATIVDKDDPRAILELVGPETDVVAIDEVQFFGPEIVDVCRQLLAAGKRVIVAGLAMDFRGESFGSMPALLASAEEVQRVFAICNVCGDDASFTQRVVNGVPANYDDPIIVVGAQEAYEARCRSHHEVPGKPK